MKRFAVLAAKALVPLVVLLLGGILYLYHKDYSSWFQERRGRLTRVESVPAGIGGGNSKEWLTLENDQGLQVNCGLLFPAPGRRDSSRPSRYPAIVVLGGKATGKYAIDYAFNVTDLIVAAPDYPYTPRQSYTLPQFLADVPDMRAAALAMIPSVMLLLDYLWQREDVDTTRIVLMGYSFGAPLVPCLIAHDRRPAAVVLVYGGGDLRSLIRHNVARFKGWALSELVAELGGLLLRPLEPLRYADRISPTPLIMVNGTQDEQVPQENVEILYKAAQEPKKLVWLESRHVNPRNPELTIRIIQTVRQELRAAGVLQ